MSHRANILPDNIDMEAYAKAINQSNMEQKPLRQSWKETLGKEPDMAVMDKMTGGMRMCALCGVKADAIADWWLSTLKERIEGMKYDESKHKYAMGWELGKEIGYNKALENVKALLN